MNEKLLVYDETKKSFRDLDVSNYNDDYIIGTLFFERIALEEIKKYYIICGYALIEKETNNIYPIDIHKTNVVMLEGTYNSLQDELKKELIKYNLHTCPEKIWSHTFFMWQFMCDFSVFDRSGPLIKLCHNIFSTENRMRQLIDNNISIYEPISYNELCVLTKELISISKINIYEYDYYDSFKYMIDSLIKGYHINFSEKDITKVSLQICQLIDENWK